MLKFVLRRLFSGVVLIFGVSSLTFFMLNFSATTIARNILGEYATETQVQAKTVELGLDRPLLERYFDWLGGAFSGNMGRSWFTSEKVATAILSRLPVTLSVVFISIALTAVLAVLIGSAAAVYRGWIDRAVQILSIVGHAVPSFIIAVLVVSVLAVQLRWFPATGYTSIQQSLSGWALSITLPIVALVIGVTASSAQHLRSAMLDVFKQDWVRTLRSRGIGEREITFKYVLRSAAPAGLTILSLQFVALLGGNVIIERIFAIPGIGSLAVQSTTYGDIPIVMAVVLFTIMIVVVVNLLVDLANGWLNPKARAA